MLSMGLLTRERPAPSRRAGVLIGVLVTFLWSISVVLIRIGVSEEGIDPIGFAGVRFTLGAMLLLPLAAQAMRAAEAGRPACGWLVRVALYGLLVFCVAQIGFYVALGELPAATIGLAMGIAPVVTTLVVMRSVHERASSLQVAGIAVLVVGVVAYFGLELPVGSSGLALLAAASIPVVLGGSARLGRHVAVDSRRYGGPIAMTALAMIVGGVATLVIAIVVEGVPAFDVVAWLLIAWLAIVNSALTYTLWAQSQRALRAVESSVLSDLVVLQIALLGWIVLGEGLGPTEVVGLALAVAGVVIVQVAPVLRRPGASAS